MSQSVNVTMRLNATKFVSDLRKMGAIERMVRAVYVLWSGHYDELTAAEARALIDSDKPLLGLNETKERP